MRRMSTLRGGTDFVWEERERENLNSLTIEVVIRASISLDDFELLSGNLTTTFMIKISC